MGLALPLWTSAMIERLPLVASNTVCDQWGFF
jgi:hypothetical protein